MWIPWFRKSPIPIKIHAPTTETSSQIARSYPRTVHPCESLNRQKNPPIMESLGKISLQPRTNDKIDRKKIHRHAAAWQCHSALWNRSWLSSSFSFALNALCRGGSLVLFGSSSASPKDNPVFPPATQGRQPRRHAGVLRSSLPLALVIFGDSMMGEKKFRRVTIIAGCARSMMGFHVKGECVNAL